MKESQRQSKGDWKKTPYANLIQYVPSRKYYARVRIKGKLIIRSLKTDVLTIAKLRLADLEKQERKLAETTDHRRSGKMTVGEAVRSFMQKIERRGQVPPEDASYLKPRTVAYYKERLVALRKSWRGLEKKTIRSVTSEECKQWSEKFGQDSSPVAYNHTVGFLRKIFEEGIAAGAIYLNPASAITWRREKPKAEKLPEPDQFHKLVESVRGAGGGFSNRCGDLVEFLAYGGFRHSEAKTITWGDCDFKRGVIVLRGDPKTGLKNRPNGEVRKVPMIPEMRQLLIRLRSEQEHPPASQSVMAVNECLKALRSACERLGIPHLTHHSLRKVFATRCIESGVDIPTVSRWLGHKDGGALLMRVYGHLRDEHSVNMAQKVTFVTNR